MTWWVLTTAPACEQRVVRDLADAGFEAWTPVRLVRFKTRNMRRPAERFYPTFPNYAFVDPGAGDPFEAWHQLRAVEDLRAILCNAGRPLALDDEEMARVRAHLEALASKPVDAAVWCKDDRVRIAAGPFEDQEGVIARGPRRGSVSVLLGLFGRETATEVSVEILERAA